MEPSYCGFYRWHIVVAGYGDSMVAVHHEVGIAYLVELDRRQVLAPLERTVYALPPLHKECWASPSAAAVKTGLRSPSLGVYFLVYARLFRTVKVRPY
jgi:hypothetical protein